MQNPSVPHRHPFTWIPSLYCAEGLPNYAVGVIAVLMYQSLGSPNDQIAHWTGLLTFAWALKAFWSPLVELAPSKKTVIIWFELIAGAAMVVAAFSLQLPYYFSLSIAMFAVVALASATHDIAADGLYIASLSVKQQAAFAGWQGGFYNSAKFISLGGLPILQGALESRIGTTSAWTVIFCIIGGILIVTGIYHIWALPDQRKKVLSSISTPRGALAFGDVFTDFMKKPSIWLAIVFIILFRAGDAQLSVIGPLFLRDSREAGGLGLTMSQFGQFYGVGGTIAFIVGTILGGYFAAWAGLKRAIIFMILAMNLPNIAFYYMSMALPTNPVFIASAIAVEMFGFGFGFVGIILFIMQVVSVGKYRTAHYAIGTGLMALGYSLFRTISGDIQMALGYQHFFLWVLLAAIPVFMLSFIIVPDLVKDHEPEAERNLHLAAQPE